MEERVSVKLLRSLFVVEELLRPRLGLPGVFAFLFSISLVGESQNLNRKKIKINKNSKNLGNILQGYNL